MGAAPGRLTRTQLAPSDTTTTAAWRQVVGDGVPLLVPRGSREPGLREFLAGSRLRDAALVPLRGEAGIVGALWVGDRTGDTRSFDSADLRLLETVATHLGTALQNGRLIDQLRHEALHDGLTGLPNRVLLARRLAEAAADCRAGQSAGQTVMICDLDGFKQVNDTLGHAYGDLLLQEVGRRFLGVPPGMATVARLGGDEFAVLVPGLSDEQEAVELGRAVGRSLEEPLLVDGLDLEVGASVGVAVAPQHGLDVSALLKRADTAMYAAKSAGSGVRLYEAALDADQPGGRTALVGELRDGIASGELLLYVQPQAELRTGRVCRGEALVRWRHPQLGMLRPEDFVPVAERSGLVRAMTSAVLDRALGACAEWAAAGHPVGVTVNLSRRSLLDLDLAEEVDQLLRRHALPARSLTLEVTESSVLSEPTRAPRLLERLHAMGVRLSLDGFGIGYSSLAHLKRLPVDEVKIDRSVVSTMMTSADDDVIVRSVVDLAANLSLQVVAEGVEDSRTWQRLVQIGCHRAQGYYLSRPMPVEAMRDWLAADDAGARFGGASAPVGA